MVTYSDLFTFVIMLCAVITSDLFTFVIMLCAVITLVLTILNHKK